MGGVDSYQKSTWSLGDNYIKEYNDWFLDQQTQFLLGRYQIVLMALLLFISNILTHLRHIKSISSFFVAVIAFHSCELKID